MGLFSKSKKEETTSCCCGGCTPEAMAQAETEKNLRRIKVLGSGCASSALELAAVRRWQSWAWIPRSSM